MFTYLLQFSVFLFVFWAVYELLLKQETFFTYNRCYLLITPILSAILPLLSFNILESYAVEAQQFTTLPTVFIGDTVTEKAGAPSNYVSSSFFNFFEIYGWWLLYGIGFMVSLLFFVKKINQFRQIKKNGKVTFLNKIKIVEVANSKIACTFLKNIYIGSALSSLEKEQILKHEQVHAQQYHSLDLLFFEFLKIVFWFNPMVFIYQKRLTNLHEYIADAEATKHSDKRKYYESLLNVAFGSEQISFIHQFFNHSLIKKRIVMLQKSKSAKAAKFKFLILIPLIFAMLTYVSCSDSNSLSNDSGIENLLTAGVSEEDAQLINELEQELQEMENNGGTFDDIAAAFMIEKDEHIKSKDAFYRMRVFSQWIFNNIKKRKIEEGTWNKDEESKYIKSYKKGLSQSYED